MTNFHQGSPHYPPVWIDQTPGARDNSLPGPWPDEDAETPDENTPSPEPSPPPEGTVQVFNESSIVDDAALRDELKTPMRTAVRRWNGLIAYTRDQFNTLRASWDGGTTWSGATWWPREQAVGFDGGVINVTKIHYFAGGTGANSTIAACGRVRPRQGQNTNQLCQGFIMLINTDQIGVLTDQQWSDVFTHEMGHGLGISSSCWTTNVNTDNSTLSGGAYPTARNAYRTLTNSESSDILLNPIVPGTANTPDNSHWEDRTRDGVRGFTNELMIPTRADNMVISSFTLGVLRDQGYQIIGDPEGTPTLTDVRQTFRRSLSDNFCGPVTIFNDPYEEEI